MFETSWILEGLDIRGTANERPEKPKITDQALWLALGLLRTKQDAGSSLWVSKDGISRILMIVEEGSCSSSGFL